MTRPGAFDPERWKALEPLLDAALDREPAERAAFLAEACGDDAPLRAELESLLAACAEPDPRLDGAAASRYARLLAAADPPLPDVLGDRYRIVREIGRGGMATVYLAEDVPHAGRSVAVKVLHASVARAIGRERFQREIAIVAGLSHPHVLPLHDSGTVMGDGGEVAFLYYVTPYVAGESLREWLAREPAIGPAEAKRVGLELASALDHAHRRGVVHLDVKPGNVLLLEGHAVLADFGVARALADSFDGDAPRGALIGTPAYLSPEQADPAFRVDARSDVYALGCVLYEMLAGRPPFVDQSLTHALARARHRTPVDPAPLRARAPAPLADVVLRAMAPSPDDRWPSAAAMAAALRGDGETGGERARRRGAVLAVLAVGCVAIVAAARAVALWRRDPPLDDRLVAVAPFDVATPALRLWREGLVDVVSRALDGAGATRAVPPSRVLRRWTGRADAPSALALGRATGARLVLYGGLMGAGDSVRAEAVLLDVRTGEPLLEIAPRDAATRVDRIADSLAVAVLRQIGQARGVDIARATASPTRSLTALRAYLQGEQFYRAARWDSAQAHFERAVALDSTFALAYHRLAGVLRWRDVAELPDSAAFVLMRRPARVGRGLAARERLLATIDSLQAESYFAWRRGLVVPHAARAAEAMLRDLLAMLDGATARYPDDAELAYLRAEAWARYSSDATPGGLGDRTVVELFDRAIALDSSFAPAYVVPIARAAYLDGAAGARRYVRAFLARAGDGPHVRAIALADVLLDPVRARALDVARVVDTLPGDALCEASSLLRHLPDGGEVVVRFAAALLRAHAPTAATASARACAALAVVDGLRFHGRLRDARRLAQAHARWRLPDVDVDLALAGILPADSARAEFAGYLQRASRMRLTRLFAWWAADGDTASIARYVAAIRAALPMNDSPIADATLRAQIARGVAFGVLARHDTAGALRGLLASSDTLDECRHESLFPAATLLSATSDVAAAARVLARRWPGTSSCGDGTEDVRWSLERGRVLERLGRRGEAAAAYALVATAWEAADPELQPAVREARAAVARLGARGLE